MNWSYLVGIILSFLGMVVLDFRHRLTYWHDARRTVQTVLIMTIVFIVWDIFGISLGIFLVVVPGICRVSTFSQSFHQKNHSSCCF